MGNYFGLDSPSWVLSFLFIFFAYCYQFHCFLFILSLIKPSGKRTRTETGDMPNDVLIALKTFSLLNKTPDRVMTYQSPQSQAAHLAAAKAIAA